MGIIKAAVSAVGGGLADQWLEVIESGPMSDGTVFCTGVAVRKNDSRGSNRKGSDGIISNGSVIHVGENQFMLLTDGGKVVDYTAEPGYFLVNNETAPSMFSGSFGAALKETFERIKFGGVSPYQQRVFFINLQEIKNIPFGTPNPVNYFDNFYNAELFLRAYGYYSIKVTEPLKFYAEVLPKDRDRVDFKDIQEMYLSEFLNAFQTALNQMSVDGIRISHVSAKGMELAKYMSSTLDEDWAINRGMEIQSVGIKSISYDEESKKLINMRNQGAMLSDPSVREGYVQGAAARGLEAAGSNSAGAMAGFMGVNMASQGAGGFGSAASSVNQAQMAAQAEAKADAAKAAVWKCRCGTENTGAFCSECGAKKPDGGWKCSCGAENTGKFCTSCGAKRPAGSRCSACGWSSEEPVKFCPECGAKLAE